MPTVSISHKVVCPARPARHQYYMAGRRSLLSAIFLIFTSSGTAHGQTPLSVAEIARRTTPATVTVLAIGAAGDTIGQGSGFIVRTNGTIITNWHVLEGAHSAIVVLATGEKYDRVLYVDGDSAVDLAIIRVPGYELPVLATTGAMPEVGERVVVIGSPLGLSRTVTDGIVSAMRLSRGRQLVQMSAAISPGSSGGPVLDAAGRAVAVATSYLEGGQQLNFAVPVRYALGLLDTAGEPREIRSVFATGTVALDGRNGRAPAPASAGRARPTLAGTYSVAERFLATPDQGQSFLGSFQGHLFLGSKGDGLARLRRVEFPDTVYVMWVDAANTRADGQVGLEYRLLGMDGYQTERGFYAQGEGSLGNLYLRSMLEATAAATPLTDLNGIYEVSTRTTYISGSYRSTTDWVGELIAAENGQTIYLRLYLENSSGGTSGADFSGPLRNGEFNLATRDGSMQLTGSIRSGRLTAQWIDRRDRARYEGRLIGTRR
jgi:hypothetical protein